MNHAKVAAIAATAYNLHIGPKVRGPAMSPTIAQALSVEKQISLCRLLAERGGSDLWSQADAADAAAYLEG